MTTHEEERSRETLRRLLEEHDADAYTLPPLGPSTDIFEPLRKLFDRIGNAIESLLRRFFRDSAGVQISDSFVDALVALSWIVLAVIVAVVLYQCFRYLLPYARRLTTGGAGPRRAPLTPETFDSEIERAEREGDLSRALRLRWRLLLRRKILSPATTPQELLFLSPVESPELSSALGSAMFDPAERPDKTTYDDLRTSVSSLEGRDR